MALDKLVDSTKLDACLDAEADAIRAKTGGSADIPFDYANNKGFADAIAAIPSGGGITAQPLSVTQNGTYTAPSGTAYTPVTVNVPTGGSLPSVITKIDGGSFTLATNTDCRTYDIPHSIGVVPKAFVIWTEDITIGEAQSISFLVRIDYSDIPYSATTASSNMTIRISTNGSAVGGAGGITAANVSGWVTASKICVNYNTNYKAGCTYQWLAWA